MTNQTQAEWVLSRIKLRGYVTRNEALAHYIGRLSAIMGKLENHEIKKYAHLDFIFCGEYVRNGNGMDYKYTCMVGREQIKER